MVCQTSASLACLFTAHKIERENDAWPSPELSIGRLISKYGKVSCWEAKGPARVAFDNVAPKIKDFLEESVEPISRWVTWSIYMLGKTPCSASPTIMFCCEVAAHRKEVRNIVRESGLLSGYRGIKTGHMPKAPDFEQLISLKPNPYPIPDQIMPARKQCNGRKGFVGDSKSPATIGGVVKLGGRFYYTTAAHVFQSYERRAEGAGEDEGDEDSGIDIDGFDVGDFDSDEEADSDSKATPPLLRPSSSSNYDPASDSMSLGPPFLSSLDESGPHSGLDYALIEVSDPIAKGINEVVSQSNTFKCPGGDIITTKAVASSKLETTKVVLSPASGRVLTGILSGAPIYCRSPNSTQFTMSLSAVFDSPLQVGDCGSWVVDAETGNLYGHIVAGSPDTGRAIVVPFDCIFEDIERRTGEQPQLPTEVPKVFGLHLNEIPEPPYPW